MHRSVNFVAAVLLFTPVATAGAAPSAERQDELLHLLKQDCGSCHGMTLKGGLGPALLPGSLEGKPDSMLIETVLNGRPGTAMPPWETMLSRDEVQWLVQRMRQGVSNVP
ncbi:MAG: cytochrome c [Pseudomonadota bacterium]